MARPASGIEFSLRSMNRTYSNGQLRPKRERKLTYVCRTTEEYQHCSGVNSLLLNDNFSKLFTASRDSTVKRWSLDEGSVPGFEHSYEDHSHWVNDAALLDTTLLTCSSDTTIKAWGSGSGRLLRTWNVHTDYVQAVVAAPMAGKFASAGLGAEVFIWDLQAAEGPLVQNRFDESSARGYAPLAVEESKESVYALAMTPAASLVAAGSVECDLRLWDPRTGLNSFQLKGHKANVKALVMEASGRFLVSGSSDNTFCLWDLGQQRIVQTFAVHTDSVWALATDPSFSHVYSGGRDGGIYATSLRSGKSALLAQEARPVRALALQPGAGRCGARVWTATTGTPVRAWATDVGDALDGEAEPASSFMAAGLQRMSIDRMSIDRPPAAQSAPEATIPGGSSVVRHTVLNNKLHLLIEYCSGHLALWDVTKGTVVTDFGCGMTFEEKEKELRAVKEYQASWFTVDTRMGCVSITLDPSTCFSAEMYAIDLGVPITSDELKVNMGEQILQMLLARWRARRPAAPVKLIPEPAGDAAGDTDEEKLPEEGIFPLPVIPPALLCDFPQGGTWRRLATALDGTEGEELLPAWAINCVAHRRMTLPKDANKLSFYLIPGPGMQPLSQGKLSAPRILRIQKVINYVAQRLGLDDEAADAPADFGIDILCNDKVLEHNMSLATVKQYIWKKGDDIELCFRLQS